MKRRRCPLSPRACRNALIAFVVCCGLAYRPPCLLASTPERQSEELLDQAQGLERQHRWLEACHAYDDLLRRDREQVECHDGYLRCLRHYYLSRRHQDAAYRQAVA